ncbi:bifunctional adenosylcobinamide kinase/adenosylcobinamide-phosphate guanylyltransferase [Niallia sp. XMNu-256]|uniref:bifunctional adenosylcobinamide kinase/adenosylcobinamide-phosphate guanylyltransferase n=1 Tax=Niallia sp. XMNu-256 TaxID=3082444 RepID=UPI0030D2488D
MHFVTGGAFNGKSAWVRAYNQLTQENCQWFSAYHCDPIPVDFDQVTTDYLVLEGIERWIREGLQGSSGDEVQETWRGLLRQLENWESMDGKGSVILIGTDITKGIVPLEREDRLWRDVCGRVFQAAVSSCGRVDVIWYGLNKRLK